MGAQVEGANLCRCGTIFFRRFSTWTDRDGRRWIPRAGCRTEWEGARVDAGYADPPAQREECGACCYFRSCRFARAGPIADPTSASDPRVADSVGEHHPCSVICLPPDESQGFRYRKAPFDHESNGDTLTRRCEGAARSNLLIGTEIALTGDRRLAMT